MGHDTHFLGRLDRVSDAHVERALTLYRDEALLQEVLGRADLAEGTGRLAISLDDPVDGPFVIVTRAGRFVTCLGKGMRITKEPNITVLTRERLDAAAAKVERMRERLATVARIAQGGSEGLAARAVRHMSEDGQRFCREDAEPLIVVTPLVAEWVVDTLAQELLWVLEHSHQVAYLRFDRLKPREEELALNFDRAAWRLSHLLVLCGHEEVQERLDALKGERNLVHDFRMLLALTTFELGTLAHATRALWLLGRRPRRVLRELKDLASSPSGQWRKLREMGLGVIALSSSKHRAEALKALSRPPPTPTDPRDARGWLDASSAFVAGAVREIVDHADAHDATALRHGRVIAARFKTGLMDVSAEQTAAVPEPAARAILGVLTLSWLDKEKGGPRIAELWRTLPWIARAEPADLFPPREYARCLPASDIRDVAAMVTPYAEATFRARPKPVVRRGEKVGRNDPCACGSGKKRKHCCGTAAVAKR